MKNPQIIDPGHYQPMPRRNGLGHTIELCRQNFADGEGFAGRLSMAEVTDNGEFSNFSDYDRVLLMLNRLESRT